MFTQIVPALTDDFELSHDGVRLKCQAGFFRSDKQGIPEIYQPRELKFRPEGTCYVCEFPFCRPPPKGESIRCYTRQSEMLQVFALQLVIFAPEVLDFYLFVNEELFIAQKLLPNRLNFVNRSIWGSIISPSGPEVWLRVAFGKATTGVPQQANRPEARSETSPQTENSHLDEVAAGNLFEEALRKVNEAHRSETVKAAVQESEVGEIKSGSQFTPMNYDYDASWIFPLKLVFVEEKSQGLETGVCLGKRSGIF